MTPCCTKHDCFEEAEYNSVRGEGSLCAKHAKIEADELAHLS